MGNIIHSIDLLPNSGFGGASSFDPGDANSGAEGATGTDTYLPPQETEIYDFLELANEFFGGVIQWFKSQDANPSSVTRLAMGCSAPSHGVGQPVYLPEPQPALTPMPYATAENPPNEENNTMEVPSPPEVTSEEADTERYFSKDGSYYAYDNKERHIRIFEEKTFQGILFPKDSEIWFDEKGRLYEALLESAPKNNIQGIKFIDNVFLRFYESGRLKTVQICQDHVIYGRIFEGELELEFDEKGRILRTTKTEPCLVSPIQYWIPP